ncbi:MAG: TSUP family transporter [Bacilli bacterium]|jgi:uncharacterized membrane protein YfcA|nr:TSUP family transporter [Bacilli bacterium]
MGIEFDWSTLLIAISFMLVGAFVDSIAGGGGIFNVVGLMMAGLPIHAVIGTNKTSAMFGTAIATHNYFKNGYFDKKYIPFSVIGALLFAFLGSWVGNIMNTESLTNLMMIAIPIVGILMLFGLKPKEHKKELAKKKIYFLSCLVGSIVGFYDGLIGPGGGTFYIIGFSLAGLSLLEANGNAKIVNLASNIASAILFLLKGRVVLWLVIPCIIASMIGGHIGSTLAIKNGDKIVKPAIVCVLILLIAKSIFKF